MAKFSVDDAGDEDPTATVRVDKRKREDDPVDSVAGEGPQKGRNVAAEGAERAGRAVTGVERTSGCGRENETAGWEGDGGISVRIDPDVLDCSICFEPLRPPLYQCQNGHVACFSCWSKLNDKCHICSRDANFARNIALEKIVESIKSSCSYAKWGCWKLVCYAQRNAHEEACPFAPSLCPIPACGYRGFTGCWSGHFLNNHSADSLRFNYDQSFEVNLEVSLPFLVLLSEDDHLFLLLNKNVTPFGHAFSVVCLRSGNLNWKFSYEFKAASKGHQENCLQLKASVTNKKDWVGVHPADAFLLVPYDFCSSTNLRLDVCIKRYTAV